MFTKEITSNTHRRSYVFIHVDRTFQFYRSEKASENALCGHLMDIDGLLVENSFNKL